MAAILVATDLSTRSVLAVERALWLADTTLRPLTVVYAVDADLPAPVRDRMIEEAERLVSDMVRRGGPALDVTIDIRVGRIHREIVTAAEEVDADLIVLGAHRRTSMSDLFLGTKADRVLRHTRRPVLLAQTPSDQAWQRIAVNADLTPIGRRAFEFAVKLAPEAEFDLIHIYDVPMASQVPDASHDSYERQIAAQVDRDLDRFVADADVVSPRVRRVACQGAPGETLIEVARNRGCQAIVLSQDGHHAVSDALFGSLPAEIMHHATVDVLVVQDG